MATSARSAVVVAAVLMLIAAGGEVRAQQDARNPRETGDAAGDDDRFVRDLADLTPQTVDRKRLARLVFGAAATLEGGRANVQLLQVTVTPREPGQQSVRQVAESRYAAYAQAVAAFRESAARLLDVPGSVLGLHRAVVDGQDACWALDGYSRLVETYGASSVDMMSILSSTEACSRLRRASFTPAVRGIVDEALRGGQGLADENARLRRENEQLESELDDLDALLRDLTGDQPER